MFPITICFEAIPHSLIHTSMEQFKLVLYSTRKFIEKSETGLHTVNRKTFISEFLDRQPGIKQNCLLKRGEIRHSESCWLAIRAAELSSHLILVMSPSEQQNYFVLLTPLRMLTKEKNHYKSLLKY